MQLITTKNRFDPRPLSSTERRPGAKARVKVMCLEKYVHACHLMHVSVVMLRSSIVKDSYS